jgi:DNA-binding transcriptional MerR regulator
MIKTKIIDIGYVSKYSGLSVSTLRFYEEKGLIKSVGRNGLRRVFDSNVLEYLSLISLGKHAGFSLDEIKNDMFSENGYPIINRDKLLNKINELDTLIKHLVSVRDGIEHVINCPEKNQLDCKKFQNLLKNVNKTSTSNKFK